MKILYVGGIYFCEYSLIREAQANPAIDLRWVLTGDSFFPGCYPTTSYKDIVALRQQFKPDLVVVRNWCDAEQYGIASDLHWLQELTATDDDGTKRPDPTGDPFVVWPRFKHRAYTSKQLAAARGLHWLPYCASSRWSASAKNRDIPVAMATNLPPAEWGGHMKRRSMDILVQPVANQWPDKLWVFSTPVSNLNQVPYLTRCSWHSYTPQETMKVLGQVNIYISPTTVWNDPGNVSYKVFEGLAAGCLVLTNRYPGIEDVFGPDGQHLIYSNSQEETLEKVGYYLVHDKERNEVVARGQEFLFKNFDWHTHLSRVAEEMKVI